MGYTIEGVVPIVSSSATLANSCHCTPPSVVAPSDVSEIASAARFKIHATIFLALTCGEEDCGPHETPRVALSALTRCKIRGREHDETDTSSSGPPCVGESGVRA
jgi:hypothetical protein